MKSISTILEVQKVPFFGISEPMNFEFGEFQPSRTAKISFTQNSESLKLQKWQFLNLWKHQN